ncbi:MAG TPA: hypothetical protein VKW04_17080 [Planctomycetota bacterium]|nr:hypothetical protein [Planctomycetota bacterium]
MTETALESAVESLECWLRDVQRLKEGLDYQKRTAGAWTEFHVREERYVSLVEAYVAYTLEKAGGEAAFNLRNSFKYPLSHARGVRNQPPTPIRPDRNPGKRDKHHPSG